MSNKLDIKKGVEVCKCGESVTKKSKVYFTLICKKKIV